MQRRACRIDTGREPWAAAHAVIERLSAAGHQAVVVGGAVRDELLGRPVKDVDVATDASPEAVAACFARTLDVGRQFGIVVVVLGGGRQVEVASFRSESGYRDRRHPDHIAPSDEAGDVARRDFTVNALVLDLVAGEIRDHVGGLDDLAARRLRTVGEPARRFAEDRLRVLRALRFASQCELAIEPATASALAGAALGGLSRERIWDEWQRGLAHPSRARWWGLVADYRLASGICPLLAADHAEAALAELPPEASAAAGIALLLRGVAAAERSAWLRGEPIAKTLRRRIETLAGFASAPAAVTADAAGAIRQALAPEAAEAPAVLRACGAAAASAQVAAWRARWPDGVPAPLLDGGELRALGIPPGPELGRWQRRLEDARLRGDIAAPEQARAQVRAWLSATR